MKYEFKPSFDRSIKALLPNHKTKIKDLCVYFIGQLESNCPLPPGIGLKRLRNGYWEIRHGLRDRILFRWEQDSIEFILAGDHKSIKNFLRNC